MILTSQMTADYYLKAKPLLESIKRFWHDRFVLGCIGFIPTDFDDEWFHVEREDIPSYRVDYPKNRPSFVTMQNGDFAKYIDCPDDEIIICVDADTVMQRGLTRNEIDYIGHVLQWHYLLSVYPNYPAQTIKEAADNTRIDWQIATALFPKADEKTYEFTTSFLIAKKWKFIETAEIYNNQFLKLKTLTDHHAGNQWLLSLLNSNHFPLPPIYQCASWYTGFDTTTENGILKVNGETVIFNHTKFNT